MFKYIFIRIENILLIIPAVAGYLFAMFFHDNYCNVLIFDSHFLISHLEATTFWIIILFIPYIMHYAIRKRKKGNLIIALLHIVPTLSIVIFFPFLYYKVPLILDQWHHLTMPPPLYEKWQTITFYANMMWITLILIQLLFFIYGFSILYKKEVK